MNAVRFILELVDRVTAPARRVEQNLSRLQTRIAGVATAHQRGGQIIERAGRGIEAVNRRVAASFAGISSMARTARGLMQAAFAVALGGGAVGMLGKVAIEAAGYKQQQLTALTTLLGDRDRAAGAVNWAVQFAAETPFETKGVLAAMRQNVGAGFSLEQSQAMMRIVGNATSATGGGAFEMERLQLGLGQMANSAKLNLEDFKQVQEVMPGAREFLAEKFGPNWMAKQAKGQISGAQAYAAIMEGAARKYEGAMEAQSKTIFGMVSTLKSRPFELFSSLMPDSGEGGPLKPFQDFLSNLTALSDFSSPPGSTIKARFESGMAGLAEALFGPLARATEGDAATATMNRMLNGLDNFSYWWAQHGPGLIANIRGFGEGLRGAYNVVVTVLRPFAAVFRWVARMFGGGEGGDDSGSTGRAIGFVLGMAAAVVVLNAATLGLVGTLARLALGGVAGGVGKALAGPIRNATMEVLTNPAGRAAGAKAVVTQAAARRAAAAPVARGPGMLSRAGGALGRAWTATRTFGSGLMTGGARVVSQAASRGAAAARGGLAAARGFGGKLLQVLPRVIGFALRIGSVILRAFTPIGWAITAVLALIGLGVLLYRRWEPFRKLIDGLWDGIKSAGNTIREGLINAGERVQAWWQRLPDSLRAGWRNLVSWLTGQLTGLWNSLPAPIRNAVMGVVNATQRAASGGLRDAGGGAGSGAFGATVQDRFAGVQNWMGSVTAPGRNLVATAVQAIDADWATDVAGWCSRFLRQVTERALGRADGALRGVLFGEDAIDTARLFRAQNLVQSLSDVGGTAGLRPGDFLFQEQGSRDATGRERGHAGMYIGNGLVSHNSTINGGGKQISTVEQFGVITGVGRIPGLSDGVAGQIPETPSGQIRMPIPAAGQPRASAAPAVAVNVNFNGEAADRRQRQELEQRIRTAVDDGLYTHALQGGYA